MTIYIFVSVMYRQARSSAVESSHFTAIKTFQLIFGILYHKMESIDHRDWNGYKIEECIVTSLFF